LKGDNILNQEVILVLLSDKTESSERAEILLGVIEKILNSENIFPNQPRVLTCHPSDLNLLGGQIEIPKAPRTYPPKPPKQLPSRHLNHSVKAKIQLHRKGGARR
jgi:hypothetical protein